MDHRDEAKIQEVQKDEVNAQSRWVEENGKKFRVPYGIIKLVNLENLSQQEMKNIEHVARVQYRLLLHDAILRAKIEYVKRRAEIIYNPPGADNYKEKISLDDIIHILAENGITVDRSAIKERDYDYYKEFYNYTFHPNQIRESTPYGYTKEEWEKVKAETEKVRAKKMQDREKNEQERLDEINHEIYGTPVKPKKKSLSGLVKDAFAKLRSINN